MSDTLCRQCSDLLWERADQGEYTELSELCEDCREAMLSHGSCWRLPRVEEEKSAEGGGDE